MAQGWHYNDATWAYDLHGNWTAYSTICSSSYDKNSKLLIIGTWGGDSTSARWIHLTKGQYWWRHHRLTNESHKEAQEEWGQDETGMPHVFVMNHGEPQEHEDNTVTSGTENRKEKDNIMELV